MVDRTTSALTIASTLGLCDPRGNWPLGVGAGAGEGLLVAADGLGGHGTGWLCARLAVRALGERFASSDTEVRFSARARAARVVRLLPIIISAMSSVDPCSSSPPSLAPSIPAENGRLALSSSLFWSRTISSLSEKPMKP